MNFEWKFPGSRPRETHFDIFTVSVDFDKKLSLSPKGWKRLKFSKLADFHPKLILASKKHWKIPADFCELFFLF